MSSIEKKNKVFVSCGEMSGDLHLSYIIKEMLKKDKNLEIHGIVGDRSIQAGAKEISHIKNNDIMGFVEILKKYKYFKKKAYEYLDYIKKNNIKTVIFVDFGGFNLKFFELLKKEIPTIKTIYYIPPKVWAWGKKRIKKLKLFDEVIVIFPFEKKYFDSIESRTGLNVVYLGNPLVDKYEFSFKIGEKILLLPGSRKQEIEKFILPVIKFTQNEEMKKEKFILKLADESHINYVNEILEKNNLDIKRYENIEITFKDLDVLRQSVKYAIATSGTVTFELALMGLPTIVVYKTSWINAFIARKIIKIKYITLTNINAGVEIFPELLQEKFTIKDLINSSKEIEKNKKKIIEKLYVERVKLGEEKVLNKIVNYLLNKL